MGIKGGAHVEAEDAQQLRVIDVGFELVMRESSAVSYPIAKPRRTKVSRVNAAA
jgi:hypothetical protein